MRDPDNQVRARRQLEKCEAPPGLGSAISLGFDGQDTERARKLVDRISEAGGTALAIQADLTDPDAVSAMFARVAGEWAGLDTLVLNASGGMESGMAAD